MHQTLRCLPPSQPNVSVRAGLERCNSTAPLTGTTSDALTQRCNLQACPNYARVPSAWSTCSAQCGGGTQSRTFACLRNGAVPVADRFCGGAAVRMSQVRCGACERIRLVALSKQRNVVWERSQA